MGIRVPPGSVPPSGRTTQKRKDWDLHRSNVAKTNRMRRRTIRDLVTKHPDEYAELLRQECALLAGDSDLEGIEVVPHGQVAMTEREAILRKLSWLYAQLADLEAEEAEGG